MRMKHITGAGCVINNLKLKGTSKFTSTLYTVCQKASGINLTGLTVLMKKDNLSIRFPCGSIVIYL